MVRILVRLSSPSRPLSEGLVTPAPAGEDPEQGRDQPFVPLVSGQRGLAVVFNQLRGMNLIRTRESADGFAEP
jgi:hypothetical protein